MRVELSACLAVLVGAVYVYPAAAADDPRTTEDAVRAYREFKVCATQGDDARRLACYDKTMKRPDSTPTPEQRFGLTPGQVLEKQHLETPPKDLTSEVVATSRPQGLVTLTLANGQVWAAQDTYEPDLSIGVGDSVMISRAALGSFILTSSHSGNRSMRVKRIK